MTSGAAGIRAGLSVVVLSLLAAAASAPVAAPVGAQPPEERLNFVFFLVDDLGWTDLGCMGSPFYETPHIDRLAREGMRFTDAYAACTVCSPTRASVLTGRYPARLRVTDWIHGHRRPFARLKIPDWTHFLAHEEVTIAEALEPSGYVSASIGKWHLGDASHDPLSQGFDRNVGGYHRGQPPSYFAPYRIPTLEEGPEGEQLTDRLSQEAVRFITENREKPFFVYLPYYAVHTPLQSKDRLIRSYAMKAARLRPAKGEHGNPVYAGMIDSVDQGVGRILAKLEELGLDGSTAIFFTSDNGGLVLPTRWGPPTSNLRLRAGKGSSYEGGVRVPLIIKWPGVTRPGSASSEPVISADFYPTILEMAGVERDPARVLDGESLVPLLRGGGEARLEREAVFWHYPHYHPGGATPYGAIRAGHFKLIEFYEDMRVELYNLRTDIGETQDLSVALPEKRDELRKRLHSWRDSVEAQMPVANPDYDPERERERGARRPRRARRK